MSLKREQRKSLILAKDLEFRRRLSSLLIDAGFIAEKYGAATETECREKFKFDKAITNIVINGPDYPGKEAFVLLANLDEMLAKREAMVIMYLNEEQYLAVAPLRKRFTKYGFFEFPAKKADLHRVFNAIGVPKPASKAPEQQQGSEQAGGDKKNLNFYETSNHVKDTIDSLGKLLKNPADLESLEHIGQRFNGIFGAFSFVLDKPGYRELADLSHIIDDIARHYRENSELKTVEKKHLDIMMEAAKCSYLFLKALRDNQPIAPEQNESHKKIVANFATFEEIKRRESISQDDIDNMIDSAFKDHAS